MLTQLCYAYHNNTINFVGGFHDAMRIFSLVGEIVEIKLVKFL